MQKKEVRVPKEKKKSLCKGTGCSNEKSKRYLLCKTCWVKLPLNLRVSVREYSKEETIPQTLRANPKSSWLAEASKYVGMLHSSSKPNVMRIKR